MHHNDLCDSAKKLMSAKTGQDVGENIFDQSVCRVF